MTVIICLDDKGGMLFNKRRQSRDCAVTRDILRTVGDKRLLISDFSKELFEAESEYASRIIVSKDFNFDAEKDDFCFVEDRDIVSLLDRIEKIIIYKWNRIYPSDFLFDVSLLENFRLQSTEDFKGNSHEHITKEEYVR